MSGDEQGFSLPKTGQFRRAPNGQVYRVVTQPPPPPRVHDQGDDLVRIAAQGGVLWWENASEVMRWPIVQGWDP